MVGYCESQAVWIAKFACGGRERRGGVCEGKGPALHQFEDSSHNCRCTWFKKTSDVTFCSPSDAHMSLIERRRENNTVSTSQKGQKTEIRRRRKEKKTPIKCGIFSSFPPKRFIPRTMTSTTDVPKHTELRDGVAMDKVFVLNIPRLGDKFESKKVANYEICAESKAVYSNMIDDSGELEASISVLWRAVCFGAWGKCFCW